jgi:hypothetical protein
VNAEHGLRAEKSDPMQLQSRCVREGYCVEDTIGSWRALITGSKAILFTLPFITILSNSINTNWHQTLDMNGLRLRRFRRAFRRIQGLCSERYNLEAVRGGIVKYDPRSKRSVG